MRPLEAFLDLLFPPKCPFCGRVLDRAGICPDCAGALPWTDVAHALWEIADGLVCCAPLWYEGMAREGILRFKFQGGSAAALPLGALTAQCAAERLSGAFDAVTWAPVGPKRLRRRGYDQAELLARAACRLWGVRPVRMLRKTADTPAQSGLEGAAARRANVQGVYAPEKGAEIAGRRVLIIDDICTTGSTLRACAAALRRAGAASAVCAAAARTRPPSGGEEAGISRSIPQMKK